MERTEPEIVAAIRAALAASRGTSSVTLGGSRSRGEATELSDWDFYLEGDPAVMMAEVPGVLASFEPFAAFWEPLSEEAGYMVVLDGPLKVDVFPLGAKRRIQPPWVLTAETLMPIDGHFWDWCLWLGGKSLRGRRELVDAELAKMHGFLLQPLGVTTAPADLGEAVASYEAARTQASQELGVGVDPELGRQVTKALRLHGVLA